MHPDVTTHWVKLTSVILLMTRFLYQTRTQGREIFESWDLLSKQVCTYGVIEMFSTFGAPYGP